jgi:hypothetical protein
VLDRWTQHTQHCSHCKRFVAGLDTGAVVNATVGLLAAVAAAAQAVAATALLPAATAGGAATAVATWQAALPALVTQPPFIACAAVALLCAALSRWIVHTRAKFVYQVRLQCFAAC